MPYLDPDLAPGRTLSGQMWIYYGDRDHPFNVFDFCGDHSAAGIDAFLKDKSYRGYLNADALNVYDHLFRDGAIIEVGCWVHCRRHFYEAKESDPARAHLVLARIRQLYQAEDEAKKIIAQHELHGADADDVLTNLAYAMLAVGQPARAVSILERLVASAQQAGDRFAEK